MTDRSTDIGDGGVTSIMGAERYRPYSAYKDSGTEWQGKIPAHWEVKRLRFTVTKCQNGLWGDDPDGLNDVTCIRVADFDRVACEVKISQPTLRSVAPMILRTRCLRRGDLLLEKSGGGENQPVGAVVLNTYGKPAVCSNFIAQMPAQEGFDPRHLTYLHAALYAARINTRSIKQNTGIQNLDSESYLNEIAAFPDILEQRAIAAFLDRETAKIDALVAKKERLIELLQEKRTALISHAVTKGLDPDVPLKDSGVEWLGEIPAHWATLRLKNITTEVTVGVVVNPSSYVCDEGVPFIYGSDIRESGIVADTARKMSTEHSELLRKSRLQAGDLVTVRVGAPGVTAVVPPELEGANCASVVIIRHVDSFDSDWLCYVMNSRVVRYQVELVQYGAAQEQFNVSHAVEFLVPMPPMDEQTMLASFLNRETAQINALVAKVQEAIDRLKELRTALISAAVTGKIDVREATA